MRITSRQHAGEHERFANDCFKSQIGKIIVIKFRNTEDGEIVAPPGEARLVEAKILEEGKIAELTYEILNIDLGSDAATDAAIMSAGAMSFAFKEQ